MALYNFELEQLDVKIAFIQRELEEVMYMQQPEGFTVLRKEDCSFLLKQSLYGLKQSPRQWYSFMTIHDVKRFIFESFVHFKWSHDGSFVYQLLYVDDILITTDTNTSYRSLMRKFFACSTCRVPNWSLLH